MMQKHLILGSNIVRHALLVSQENCYFDRVNTKINIPAIRGSPILKKTLNF